MTSAVANEKGHVEVGASRGKPFKLYYEKTGSGPRKLLLIMGLNSPGMAWEPVVRNNPPSNSHWVIPFALALSQC